MRRRIVIILFLLLLLPAAALARAFLLTPEVRFDNGDVYVSTLVAFDQEHIDEISKGVGKDIVFYVDLFRKWYKPWPDEFVLGKTIGITLSCDPVKKEYTASADIDFNVTRKRFTSCEDAIGWASMKREIKLTSLNSMTPANYYVKVTVESRLRKLPPFINLLFFFVDENEFTMESASEPFEVK